VGAVAFQDHFSKQANAYTHFRPRYPRALFAYLSNLPVQRERAWDCGAGNGQAAVALAEFFDEVVATDASNRQIANAQLHPKVIYTVAPAEAPPLAARTVDLVAVAQALHWFDLPAFYAQVRKAGRPGSVLAAWCYGLATISPAVDAVVGCLYSDILGSYWPSGRRLIEEQYTTIDFPFAEIHAPQFAMNAQWRLDDLVGYLGTWSSVQKFIERNGADPLNEVQDDLRDAWGGQATQRVEWPLYLRVGRVG
jgi:SAM-dependent methyltransferase